MKIAGVWILLFGYTLVYVGYQNLTGNTISFLGAVEGDTPTSKAASAQSGPGVLGSIAPGVGQKIAGQISGALIPQSSSPSPGAIGVLA